jgi:hypothetical protein
MVTEEMFARLLDAEATRGRSADDLVVISADPDSETGRPLNVQLGHSTVAPVVVFEAVSNPAPAGTIRLLEFNAQDL